jgi:transcriptional regulator with XRE-family HTH domain
MPEVLHAGEQVSIPKVLLLILGESDVPSSVITSELIRAARALLRWEQRQLSEASSVSLPTLKRLEAKPGNLAAHASTVAALVKALETAGIEFTNGERPGVRLSAAAFADIARANSQSRLLPANAAKKSKP